MTILSTIKSAFFRLQQDGFNITSFMAKETEDLELSDKDAIDKLIAFGGKVEDAIYGFACAGNVAQVNKLLDDEQSLTKKAAYIGYAIKGYARAGNFEAIYKIPSYRDHMKEMVIGLAQAGNKERLQPLLDRNIGFFAQAVEGYAEGNQQKHLIKLIKGTSFYPNAIFYAARSGHTDLVNALLKDCGVTADFKVDSFDAKGSIILRTSSQINAYALLNHAVKGYASGGHFKEAAALLERGASISQCIFTIQEINGLDNLEPFYVLLSHIENEDVASKVLDQIKLRFSVSEIELLPKDMLRFHTIKELMDGGMNYLNAAKTADKEIDKGIVGEAEKVVAPVDQVDEPTENADITLPTLAQTLCEEMNLKRVKAASQSI